MNWAITSRTGTIALERKIPTPGVVAPSYDAATLAWEAAVGAINVSTGRKDLIDAFIKGLKTDGIWTKLDRLWLFAAENATSALTDLKALDVASPVNSPTFTANLGYNGNGTTSYLDITYNPGTDGVNYTGISACGGMWDVTTSVANAAAIPMSGIASTVYSISIFIRYTDNNTYTRINSTTGAQMSVAYPGPGLFMLNRSGAFQANCYYNGSSIASSVNGSATLQSVTMFVGAESGAGTPSGYSVDQFAAVIFGGSLTGTEHGNLYTRLRTYMTGVGVP